MTIGRMTIERFTEILDAYGADPLHWPEGERLAAQAFAAREPRAAALVAETERFDALLDSAPDLAPSPALTQAVLARRPGRTWIARAWNEIFPAMPVWRPALGFAAAVAIGFGLQSAAADRLGLDEPSEVVASEDGMLAPLSGSEYLAEEEAL